MNDTLEDYYNSHNGRLPTKPIPPYEWIPRDNSLDWLKNKLDLDYLKFKRSLAKSKQQDRRVLIQRIIYRLGGFEW